MKLSSRQDLLSQADKTLTEIRNKIQEDSKKVPFDISTDISKLPNRIKLARMYALYNNIKSFGEDEVSNYIPIGKFLISDKERKEIQNALEKLRQNALAKRNLPDTGEHPADGYDREEQDIQRFILSNNREPDFFEKLIPKVIRFIHRIGGEGNKFRDPQTGQLYDEKGLPVPGTVGFADILPEMEEVIGNAKKETSGLIKFLTSLGQSLGGYSY